MNNIYDDEAFFQAYAQMDRSRGGLSSAGEWHQLAPLIPDLHGKSVLDLGCGYGWHCRYASDRGAETVSGIDPSEKMIAEALQKNSAPNISYRVCSAEDYEYPENTFDFVISNLVLHYIKDLENIYKNVWKTLRPSGIFLFNIEHPVFTAGVQEDWIYDADGTPLCWPVDNYYYPGERTTRFLGHTVKKQHHTLSQILMGLIRTGFRLEAVEEAMPSPEMLHLPGMKDEMRRPMMLLVKAVKKVD